MKRLVINNYIGFQLANDATDNFVELSAGENELVAKAQAAGHFVSKDLKTTVTPEDNNYQSVAADFSKALMETPYVKEKMKAVALAEEAEAQQFNNFAAEIDKVRKQEERDKPTNKK